MEHDCQLHIHFSVDCMRQKCVFCEVLSHHVSDIKGSEGSFFHAVQNGCIQGHSERQLGCQRLAQGCVTPIEGDRTETNNGSSVFVVSCLKRWRVYRGSSMFVMCCGARCSVYRGSSMFVMCCGAS